MLRHCIYPRQWHSALPRSLRCITQKDAALRCRYYYLAGCSLSPRQQQRQQQERSVPPTAYKGSKQENQPSLYKLSSPLLPWTRRYASGCSAGCPSQKDGNLEFPSHDDHLCKTTQDESVERNGKLLRSNVTKSTTRNVASTKCNTSNKYPLVTSKANPMGNNNNKKKNNALLASNSAPYHGILEMDLSSDYVWKFDNRFYWVAFGTGIVSYCGMVGVMFVLFGRLEPFWVASYGNVLIHELGHAEAARQLGRPVKAIFVTPFGGLCCHDVPRDSWQGGLVAIAGPVAGIACGVLYVGGAYMLNSYHLCSAAKAAALINGMNLIPFCTESGQKSDGKKIWDAILRSDVTREERMEYGYEFPDDFYRIGNDERAALFVGYCATIGAAAGVFGASTFVDDIICLRFLAGEW